MPRSPRRYRSRSRSRSPRPSSDRYGRDTRRRQYSRSVSPRRSRSRSPRRSSSSSKRNGETREEKELRKRREKEEKRRLKSEKKKGKESREKLMKDVGYNDDENPFGDHNLSKKFVWKAKKDEQGTAQPSRTDTLKEVQRLRQRRDERIQEEKMKEESREKMQREKAQSDVTMSKDQEDSFLLEQLRGRSVKRYEMTRVRPVDRLVRNCVEKTLAPIELSAPHWIIKNAETDELNAMFDDVEFCLDNDKTNFEYWDLVHLILCDETKKRELTGVHRSDHIIAKGEVMSVFEGKTYEELADLERDIYDKKDTPGEDNEYWEGLYDLCLVYKACSRLDELHSSRLKRYVKFLQSQGIEVTLDNLQAYINDKMKTEEDEICEASGLTRGEIAAYGPGFFGNEAEELARMESIIDPEEEEANLELFAENFEEEFILENSDQLPEWASEHPPRKPKFYNRVHCGYEWNLYAKTHYDHENPPPKTIQGYRFNIFYPDLINPNVAPTYRLYHAEGDKEADLVTIHFSAGPPYLDLAFKIADKEWDMFLKYGFKCTYDRNILRLYFRFKRFRYRR